MNRYKIITLLAVILLTLSMGYAKAQVISVSNLNIGDTFRFSYTKISQTEIVNGTEYPIEFNVNLIDQPFNSTIIGGSYNPSAQLDAFDTDMVINPSPYLASIDYIITYDNDSLNEGEPSNATSYLDQWAQLYFGFMNYLMYIPQYFTPDSLIGDFGLPTWGIIELVPENFIIGMFVHNNETIYEQLFGETEPVIYENSTTIEDGTDLTTYYQYNKTDSSLDVDNDLIEVNGEFNFTMYGNIGETAWLNAYYLALDCSIDYGRGIITSFDYFLMMSSAYDNGTLQSMARVVIEELVPPVIETPTSLTTEDSTANTDTEEPTVDLDLDYPVYTLASMLIIGIIRYRRNKK